MKIRVTQIMGVTFLIGKFVSCGARTALPFLKRHAFQLLLLDFLALGLFIAPVSSYAVAKDQDSIAVLEKKMLADQTKKLQYRKGKIRSVKASVWKKAKRIKKTADHLTIRKKGWYTLCITTRSGKRKLTQVYFARKTYEIPMNRTRQIGTGYYYIVPRTDQGKTVEIQNASVAKGGEAVVSKRADRACQVWQLESVGGKNFRLKNVNSGMYLSCVKKKGNYTVRQKAYAAKGKAQVFRLYEAGGRYTYLKSMESKKYLRQENGQLTFTDRKKRKDWKFRWEKTEHPVSYAMVTGATYPVELSPGSAFTLQGNVYSRYLMTALTAGVYNSSGTALLQKRTTPGSCSFDLKQIDAAITFGKLPVGTYTYKVVVRDVTGREIPLINRTFTVGVPLPAGSRMLTYDSSLIDRIGHQSTGTALEKKACASYALAYCNAILSGGAPSPHTYWVSETNVDCVWSRGGYTTKTYSSEQEVWQAAFDQLAAGKPCILHVTGTTQQHWLAVVGCKKSAFSPNVSASDFVALDPWDGRRITVGEKYKVKSTFRLGIKS